MGGRVGCGIGVVVDVVEQDGAADAVVAAAYSRIGEAVLVAVAVVAAYASFSRERGISFDVVLWYGQGARAW